MLNELARELGQADIAKSPEDQRIRLLLDALRPAQALLILDNLESLPKTERDQLFTFVKRLPPGCKAILTSRRRIGSDSEELILEKLDQDAALATLADLARRNPLLARASEAERIALYTQTRRQAAAPALGDRQAWSREVPHLHTRSPSCAPARRTMTRWNSSSATSRRSSPPTRRKSSAPRPTSAFRQKWNTRAQGHFSAGGDGGLAKNSATIGFATPYLGWFSRGVIENFIFQQGW